MRSAPKRCGLGAEIAFRQIDDQDFAFVHHVGDSIVEAFWQRIDRIRICERMADLVLDRGDGLRAEAGFVLGEFVPPKGSNDRIAAAVQEPIAIGVVDQQAGETE